MSRWGMVPFSHPFSHYWREPRSDLWSMSGTPSRIFDQRFGLGLSEDDMLPVSSYNDYYLRPRRRFDRQTSGLSEMKMDNDKFQVMLDVNQFTPEELVVKTVDRSIVVHGKHREKVDEHGFISREFTRRYVLPDEIEPEVVVSSLSADGILTIEAPRKSPEEPKSNERVVPIAQAPAAAVTATAEQPKEVK